MSNTEQLDLIDLLALVDQNDRALLFLRYYVGFTQSEVAQLLGRKQSNVCRSERAALRRLRGLLEARS